MGHHTTGEVDHEDVAQWISEIRLSAASVAYIYGVFSLILELAARSGRISRNPAHGIRLPKSAVADKRFLSREEVFRLADAAAEYPIPEIGQEYCDLVLVLAFCGLRWGEVAGLKVEVPGPYAEACGRSHRPSQTSVVISSGVRRRIGQRVSTVAVANPPQARRVGADLVSAVVPVTRRIVHDDLGGRTDRRLGCCQPLIMWACHEPVDLTGILPRSPLVDEGAL